jgi:hypothetical protein
LLAKLVLTFADIRVVVSAAGSYGRNLDFLDRSRYSFFQVTPHLYSWARMDPFETHYVSENLVALGIVPGPLDPKPGTLTTRSQRRSVGLLIFSLTQLGVKQNTKFCV